MYELIEKIKEKYKEIKSVRSPALKSEVVFNKHGLNHLIRKRRKYRDASDMYRRYKLFNFAPDILQKETIISKYEENILDGYPAYFWTLASTRGNFIIKVVVRQLGQNGNKHFFSIMNRKHKNPRRGLV